MTELWHPVRHYEELYHVSSYGRVKALRKRVRNSRGHRWLPERVLSIQEKRGSGHGGQDYLYVALYGRSKRRRNFYVHRLVALAFHGDPPGFETDACHEDGNRQNNRAAVS